MSFFKNIGKAIGKVGKVVGSTTGKILKTVAPVAAIIPGVGTAVSAAAGTLGEVLSPTKQDAIIEAVSEQGVVKVDKIEDTIVNNNPNVDAATLQVATSQMTELAVAAVPNATVDDTRSATNISTGTKIIQWVKNNMLIVGGFVVGLFLIMNQGGNSRRKSRRW
jgi:hypothetical protein